MGDKIIFIDSHELSEQELQHYSDAAHIENARYFCLEEGLKGISLRAS